MPAAIRSLPATKEVRRLKQASSPPAKIIRSGLAQVIDSNHLYTTSLAFRHTHFDLADRHPSSLKLNSKSQERAGYFSGLSQKSLAEWPVISG
jgi:hypothetical protein